MNKIFLATISSLLLFQLNVRGQSVLSSKSEIINVDSALQVMETLNEDTAKIRLYGKIVISRAKSGKMPEAVQHAKEGLKLCKRHSSSTDTAVISLVSKCAMNWYNLIGSYYLNKGLNGVAMENYRTKLTIAEKVRDTLQLSSTYNNIGLIHFHQKDYDGALENYERSYELSKDKGDEARLSIYLLNIAEIYLIRADSAKEAGDIPEHDRQLEVAEVYYEECYRRAVLGEEERASAASLVALGDIVNRKGDRLLAFEKADSAIELNKTIIDRNIQAYVYRMAAKIYSDQGQVTKALELAERGFSIAQEGEILNELRDIAELTYQIQKDEGMSKEAMESLGNYIMYRDSLQSRANEQSLYNQSYEIDYEKKTAADSVIHADQHAMREAELNRQDAVLGEERLQKFGLLAIILLIAVYAFILIRGFIQRQRTNQILENQKHKIEEQKNRIVRNIIYAERIQQSILPLNSDIQRHLPGFSSIYLPKDQVSGDFYWFAHQDNCSYLALSDCTGHGVPGGFMSMIGSSLLKEKIVQDKITDPAEVLEAMDHSVRELLKQGEESDTDDGMEMALIKIDHERHQLTYSGANQHLYLVRDKAELIKSNFRSIGGWVRNRNKLKNFENAVIDLEDVQAIFLTTDGLEDQFGGMKDEKFGRERFLREMENSMLRGGIENIQIAFDNWKGEKEQIDDVCVVSINL